MVTATDTPAWLIESAARQGVAEAQLLFGQMHLDGRDVRRDPLVALHWFERAALGGSVMAMNMVGRCFDQGWGVPESPEMAVPWFRQAAEAGLDWGMYNLATLLTLGRGVPMDRAAALGWFRRAAALGHAKSMNLLGGFYEDGWEVPRDLNQAGNWYRDAAIAGDFRGQFNYARLLLAGHRLDESLDWLRRATETATPAFLDKMADFLADSPFNDVRLFAEALRARHRPAPQAGANS